MFNGNAENIVLRFWFSVKLQRHWISSRVKRKVSVLVENALNKREFMQTSNLKAGRLQYIYLFLFLNLDIL